MNFYCRAVYEGDELEKFKESLGDHIKNHDKEIERMCNYHYQGFIDSIRELLKVSCDAAQLKVCNFQLSFLSANVNSFSIIQGSTLTLVRLSGTSEKNSRTS